MRKKMNRGIQYSIECHIMKIFHSIKIFSPTPSYSSLLLGETTVHGPFYDSMFHLQTLCTWNCNGIWPIKGFTCIFFMKNFRAFQVLVLEKQNPPCLLT